MPRTHRNALSYVGLLTLFWSAAAGFVKADDQQIPTGFHSDRYQKVWERNPFTLVTPVAQQVQPTAFDKLILVSWLKEGTKDFVLVQNTETSEVQKITSDPNTNNLRLVEIHPNPNPQMVEAVLSNGKEEGPVKFKMEVSAAAQQANGQNIPANGLPAPGQTPIAVPVQPPMNQESEANVLPDPTHQVQPVQPVQPDQVQPVQPVQPQSLDNASQVNRFPPGRMPIRPGEIRRKRVLPPNPTQ